MAEFDPFAFVPKFGAIERSGRDYVFKRAGRDLSEFTDLLQFGAVRATGDRVILTLHQQTKVLGTKVAQQGRRVTVVERELGTVRTTVARLSGELRASRVVRKQGLLSKGFGVTDSGVNLGLVKLGKSGPKLNMGAIRNSAGRAFTATIVTHIVGAAANQAADAVDEVNALKKKGATQNELIRHGGGRAARMLIEGGGELTGITGLLKALNRMSGKSAEETDKQFADFFDRMFLTREELARRKRDRAAASDHAADTVRKHYEKLWEKLSTTPPAGFMLAGKREARMYRRDIKRMNMDAFNANRARDEAKARAHALQAAQGGV